MSNTGQCRNIKELNPLAQVLLNLAIRNIKAQGINPLIVETYRSQERQNYLYAQGRTRNLKSPKITWTLNSIHTLRNAVDIVPQRLINKKMTAIWNARDKETLELIKIMTQYGFEAGANWNKNTDSPHFQIRWVSVDGKEYSQQNNNTYITKMIQKRLNERLKCNIVVDGLWGKVTTQTINEWRKSKRYKDITGKLGASALNALMM